MKEGIAVLKGMGLGLVGQGLALLILAGGSVAAYNALGLPKLAWAEDLKALEARINETDRVVWTNEKHKWEFRLWQVEDRIEAQRMKGEPLGDLYQQRRELRRLINDADTKLRTLEPRRP